MVDWRKCEKNSNMPVICENLIAATKLNENIISSFKKSEKENFENNPTPTVKQVLSARIEYEETANQFSSTISSLQTKYTLLKPNQPPLSLNQLPNNSRAYGNNESNSSGNIERNVNTNSSPTSLSSNSTSHGSCSQIKLPQPKRVLFEKEKIQIGWGHQNQMKWQHGCGFNNIGNTCYLNSALQAFLHVPALAQWLVSDKEHRERCSKESPCLICAMARTLILSQSTNQSSFTPTMITNRLSQICKHLMPGRQEDAHEFLRYLIEKMEKAYLLRFKNEPWFKDLDQYSKETTPLNQILGGYLRSTVTCLSCNHESVTFQHFQDLPLDISRVSTLAEAISGYFSRENLEECGYKCESCKKRVSAAKRFTIERLPVVLCIQLKRFTPMGGKLGKPIQISERLSLHKYLSKQGNPHQDCTYRYVSMVTHLGGSGASGHYTAIAMGPNGNFYHFDDSRVSVAGSEGGLRNNGYVLFYELIQEQKHHNGSSLQNGHSIFHENGHNYIKNRVDNSYNGPCTSSSLSPQSSRPNLDKSRSNDSSFSKPSLPKMIPSNVMKQQHQQQQIIANSNSQSPKNGVKSLPTLAWSGNGKTSPGIIKTNGAKRESSECSEQEPKNDEKRFKFIPLLPSLPRLIEDDIDGEDRVSEKANGKVSPPNNGARSKSPIRPPPMSDAASKPKSLVPAYETDDEDDEESSKIESSRKEALTICHTTSGIFIETDCKKEISKIPSQKGSTISTKASVAMSKNESPLNGKQYTNGICRNGEDPVSQLTKLNHSGYGSSNVMTWNNTQTSMNKEVVQDLQEERKRQAEDEYDAEMDRGRTKKLKYNNGSSHLPSKLPNPFNMLQNSNSCQQQNGLMRHNSYNQSDRHNGYGQRHNNYSNKIYNNGTRRFGGGKDYHNNHYYSNNRNNNRNSFRNYQKR